MVTFWCQASPEGILVQFIDASDAAATSALVARCMAHGTSRRRALIGAGVQAGFQALGLQAVLGIKEVHVFDIDPATVAKALRHTGGAPHLRVTAAPSVAAVEGAAVIATAQLPNPKDLFSLMAGDMAGPAQPTTAQA